MTEFSNIQDLVKLFNPTKDDDDSEEEEFSRERTEDNSSGIAPPSSPPPAREKKPNPYDKVDAVDNELKKFATDEDYLNAEPAPSTDWKKIPKFEISYGQQVSPSDVFLQMSGKTPASASCENMIVKIGLPGEKMQNMDIKVLKDKLIVNSPNYLFENPLPHPVDPKQGNAKWNNETEELIVTLVMDREFDFINF